MRMSEFEVSMSYTPQRGVSGVSGVRSLLAGVMLVAAAMAVTMVVTMGGALAATSNATTPIGTANVNEAGFDEARLARIDARMLEALENGVMVGGHALIARHGKVIYDRTFGLADREKATPVRPDTLYRIYSMTKPITTVALLMLYEEGRFLLDDPVGRYLPELADLKVSKTHSTGQEMRVSPGRQVTVRDLLRHTGGLTYGIFGDTPVDRLYREADLLRAPTTAEFTRRLGQLPLLHEPGERWHYSVSVDVQGRLIEVLSGVSLGEFLRTRIFEPLAMHDTTFVVTAAQQPRLAQLYSPLGTTLDWNTPWTWTAETRLVPADPELTRPYIEGHTFESGGAGLVSSAQDYLRFALMLANEGVLDGTRILSPQTVRHMQRDHLQGIDSSGLWGMQTFGLGVGITGDPGGKHGNIASASAFGWGGAAGTDFWVDPEHDLVGIFMVQSLPHQTSLAKRFRVLTYQALVD